MFSGATTRACERERVAGRVGVCVSVHACSHPGRGHAHLVLSQEGGPAVLGASPPSQV